MRRVRGATAAWAAALVACAVVSCLATDASDATTTIRAAVPGSSPGGVPSGSSSLSGAALASPSGEPVGSGPVLVITAPPAGSLLRRTTSGQASGPVPEPSPLCTAVLATEGVPACSSAEVPALGSALRDDRHQLIVLSSGVRLSRRQVSELGRWVRLGHHLIAMRPRPELAGLLGLDRASAGTLDDGYYRIDTGRPPGTGLESRTLQFHGSAVLRHSAGARTVARLYAGRSTATTFPALSTNSLGEGTASAYAFDLVTSVMLLRNGNPALTGQVTTSTDRWPRLSDRFGDGYLDRARTQISQADQLTHLFTNEVLAATGLPRLWYLPSYRSPTRPDRRDGAFLPAALVLTGDDHARDSQTLQRFQRLARAQRPGCSVAGWTCPRATSYAVPGAFDDAAAAGFVEQGFEVEPHIAGPTGCPSATSTADEATWLAHRGLEDFREAYPLTAATTGPVLTERWHCYGVWRAYSSIPEADRRVGISADASGTCWPSGAFDQPQCLLSGTALPMQFPTDGTVSSLIDVDQFSTIVTDENPELDTSQALTALLDDATGPRGFYGYYVVLAHLDGRPESLPLEQSTLALAERHDLPVISLQQAETFWRARAAAVTDDFRSRRDRSTFRLRNAPARLELMVPAGHDGRRLRSITRDGSPVEFARRTVGGIEYALVPDASDGSYLARYGIE